MSRVLDAAAIASALGVSRRAVAKRASVKGWQHVLEPNPAGTSRKLFVVEALPTDVRAQLEAALPATLNQDAANLLGLGARDGLRSRWAKASNAHREMASACLAQLDQYLHHCDHGHTSREAAKLVDTSRAQLLRWRARVKDAPREDWPALLLPRWVSKSRLDEIHPDAWDWLLSDMLRPSKPCLQACYDRLLDAAKSRPHWGEIPGYRSLLKRYGREVPKTTKVYRREGNKALDALLPRVRSDNRALEAMGEVNGDGRTHDVVVRMPDGRLLRPTCVAWQDTATGVIVGHTLAETENRDGVRIALHNVIARWGVPDQARMDQGHAYASKEMSAGADGEETRRRFRPKPGDPDGVFKALGIRVRFVTPRSPWLKPIESFWAKLAERVDRHPLCDGAYTGNAPNAKPENYGSRAVPWEQFRKLVADEIERWNHAAADTLVCQGRPRLDVFRERLEARLVPPRTLTESQLHYLLMPATSVRVSTVGSSVLLLGNRYSALELAALGGQSVALRYNPDDLASGVWVCKPGELEPLCRAELVGDVQHGSEEESRIAARKRHVAKRALKEQAKLDGRLSPSELADPIKPKRERVTNVVAPDFAKPRVAIARDGLTAKERSEAEAFVEEFWRKGFRAAAP